MRLAKVEVAIVELSKRFLLSARCKQCLSCEHDLILTRPRHAISLLAAFDACDMSHET